MINADYAIGRFLGSAKQHVFFDHTLIVVLGDHGARVYGAQRFPLEPYRVPVWLFLPGGEGATSSRTLSPPCASRDLSRVSWHTSPAHDPGTIHRRGNAINTAR